MSFETQDAPHHSSIDHIKTVTAATFQSVILEGNGPIVVQFMSYGCEYCRAMEPVMQQVAMMGKVRGKLFRVNVAVEHELAESYAIEGTPTLVMFLGGQEVGRVDGALPSVAAVLTAITKPFRAAS